MAFIFVRCLLVSPLPSTTGVVSVDGLENLIGWGLKRQTTHAALTLSALVGLFSLLRLRSDILKKWETILSFIGFLTFLSYEYFKLIRSFHIVNQWEKELCNKIGAENVFTLDPLQKWFFSLLRIPVQELLIAFIVFILIRIYILACTNFNGETSIKKN